MGKYGEIRKLRAEIKDIGEDPEIVGKAYAIESLTKRQKEAEDGEIRPIAEVYMLEEYCMGE